MLTVFAGLVLPKRDWSLKAVHCARSNRGVTAAAGQRRTDVTASVGVELVDRAARTIGFHKTEHENSR